MNYRQLVERIHAELGWPRPEWESGDEEVLDALGVELRIGPAIDRYVQNLESMRAIQGAREEALTKTLASILALIPPKDVKTADGRVFQFNDPDPMDTLRALRDRIEAIREALPGSVMTEERAREILGKLCDRFDGERIHGGAPWVEWVRRHPTSGLDKSADVELDGDFTADQLEAIAWWMRNKGS